MILTLCFVFAGQRILFDPTGRPNVLGNISTMLPVGVTFISSHLSLPGVTMRIGLVNCADIAQGEELFWDYGYR